MLLRRTARAFSTTSAGRRVLCSLQQLRDLEGKGLKFPLHAAEPKEAEPKTDAETNAKLRRRRDLMATGFVFLHEKTQQPRAFINRCPHALLELDFDDSDFFCEGFIHCKAHAAFFDPDTGICLQGPISSRKALRGLDELRVEIDGDVVVLLAGQSKERFTSMPSYDSLEPEAYKREKQRELAEALSNRSEMSEIEEMQQRLHEKTMARMKQFEQRQKEAFRNAEK
ncbi:Rieske (2Fe-2S) domain protein [Phytophthora cinnamomi]|uniref:Rieske (2Fe-2S) domain protein n=1 Tax=Phytophthora cinnamomi TaxID=4785 RepID=UPI00355A9EBF|nr:Rieske (2Fe-2S) domain protein [Phytophthora cinnamomi]